MTTKLTVVKTTVGEITSKLGAYPGDQVVLVAWVETNENPQIDNSLPGNIEIDHIDNTLPGPDGKKAVVLYLKRHALQPDQGLPPTGSTKPTPGGPTPTPHK
jgi:hypothetical protein